MSSFRGGRAIIIGQMTTAPIERLRMRSERVRVEGLETAGEEEGGVGVVVDIMDVDVFVWVEECQRTAVQRRTMSCVCISSSI